MLVDQLKRDGAIDKEIFGVSFTFDTIDNEITFGGWDKETYPEKELTWIDVQSSSYWKVEADNVWYGDTELDDAMTSTILDTGSSSTYFTNDQWNEMYDLILKHSPECDNIENGWEMCDPCDPDEFKTITVQMGGRHFKMDPLEYLLKWSDGTCYIALGGLSGSVGLFGDSFLRNFYVVHDHEEGRIGMTDVKAVFIAVGFQLGAIMLWTIM